MLSESLLFFDRHIAFLGGEDRLETFARLLPFIRRAAPEKRVICEADSVETALRFARAGADGVQLDKFSPSDLARTVNALRAVSPRLLVDMIDIRLYVRMHGTDPSAQSLYVGR